MCSQSTTAEDIYFNRIHRLGRFTTLIAIISFALVPFSAMWIFDIELDIPTTLKAFSSVFVLFSIVAVTEVLTFPPLLGAGGTYVAFITGNISNMKLPAAISAMKLANVKTGTKEAEIVSTIAIAVSSLVTTSILLIGMLGLSFMLPILESPVLAPAFQNIMPALMGALATPYFIKQSKTASVPILIAALLTFVLGYHTVSKYQSLFMPVFLVLGLGWRYFLYTHERKTTHESN